MDLGCGDGAVTAILRDLLDARWQLVGVDPDPVEVSLATESGAYERVQRATGSSLGVEDGTFDFVFSNSVLEHVEDLEPTLREVARVLKDRGQLVFTVPSEFFHENLGPPRLLGRLATGQQKVVDYRLEIDRRLAHVRYLSIDEWQALLGESGLEITHTSFYMSAAETQRWAALSNATAGVLVRVSGAAARPVEIQRRLSPRGARAPFWIRLVGRTLGELAPVGLRNHGDDGSKRGSCLLVVARTSPR
jgi:SAM-dependent methyltransferase